jgi:ornithine--oxo-acid transaminase
MGRPNPPVLLTVDDALALDVGTVIELSRRHLGADQHRMMWLLGFDTTLVERAEDVYYIDTRGRRVLDFFGGFGALAMGHNHPRILAVRRRFAEQRRHEIGIADRHASSGAAQAGGGFASRSFHGKTRGALSVTDSTRYRSHFQLVREVVRVPFGDIGALANLLGKQRRIGALILETVQGGAGVVPPPPGYLHAVRQLCDEHVVLWIADEVQCGMGRTGRFFAFEHASVLPDLVTLAKSLGGGKAAVGAVIARDPVHRRACPDAGSALALGAGTFSGTGETCAAAPGNPAAEGRLSGGLAALIGSLLLAEHGVLVAFTEYDRDVLRLEPPLTVRPEHVDHLVNALTNLLSRGPRRLALDYLRVVRGW